MSKWHGGKGSIYRPTDSDAYADNWTKIFNGEYQDDQLPDNPFPDGRDVHDKCGTPECCGQCNEKKVD